jgi:hypothetical protein
MAKKKIKTSDAEAIADAVVDAINDAIAEAEAEVVAPVDVFVPKDIPRGVSPKKVASKVEVAVVNGPAGHSSRDFRRK